MEIEILITGGTLDKEYDEPSGALCFRKTHIPEMLNAGRSVLDIKITELMLVDSSNISKSEIDIILKHCKKSKANKILIIHGTSTMVHTAKILGHEGIKNKTIILTGALMPYRFDNTDGLFNLGCSIAYVRTLPPGVYISMNGKYFYYYDDVRKNKSTGKFEIMKDGKKYG